MENVSVVVAILAVYAEILRRLRAFGGKEFHVNVAFGRVQRARIVDALNTCVELSVRSGSNG